MASVRPAAVAGTFYPSDSRALITELDDLLGGVEHLAPRLGFPKALIVPHAGYIYSGPVAARAYDEVAAARGVVRRVVMLGPVHRVPVSGLALPGAQIFETTLGRIPIDQKAIQEVASLPQVVSSDPAHALEHSLEVQLPFLQKILGDFALVPLAVGMANVEEAAGSTLISIASGSISSGLGLGPKPQLDGAGWLDQVGATFVTLLRAGALRGCIGSLEAVRPIGADVADNALGAAFRDPRFPALKRDEWPLCSVEVSLLSVPKPTRFADEDHLLALIRAGAEGPILEAGGRRATFLPQVWESIADTRQFLDELMRKAGVPAGTRLARCRLSRYRVIKWKAETLHA